MNQRESYIHLLQSRLPGLIASRPSAAAAAAAGMRARRRQCRAGAHCQHARMRQHHAHDHARPRPMAWPLPFPHGIPHGLPHARAGPRAGVRRGMLLPLRAAPGGAGAARPSRACARAIDFTVSEREKGALINILWNLLARFPLHLKRTWRAQLQPAPGAVRPIQGGPDPRILIFSPGIILV